MARITYDKIPIVETARRCGLVLDSRTLRREEVEASCPFCGDHGPGKYHLSLNTNTDQYRCNLCGAHGNSVTLYAQLKGVGNKEAYQELSRECKVYPMPSQPVSQNTERQPASLEVRHTVYSAMLEHLTLLPKHEDNLLERGLSKERIEQNQYRSMPESDSARRLLATLLRSCGHELLGMPGFRTYYNEWTLSGPNGFLIPVRNRDGLIQGMKIRLDDEADPNRKYRWLSSRSMPNGTRSYSWVHVTGNTDSKRAFLTEGPLKGDVASYLSDDDGIFRCDNLVMDNVIDVRGCCRQAEELFELYQRCANRKQIETICVNYLRGLEVTKLSITGHMYFVPRPFMDQVDVFEDFINLLGEHNHKQTPLVVNSFYIIDDEKQREKMTADFYSAVTKQIAEYQERADYFIKSGCQSPAIMERWAIKIQNLEEKKRHYEQVLRRELDDLDDGFSTLRVLSQELQVRANNIRNQRFPNVKAA